MVPKILAGPLKVKGQKVTMPIRERRLALAICILYSRKRDFFVGKRFAELPANVYLELKNSGLITFRNTRVIPVAIYQAKLTEEDLVDIQKFADRKEFAATRDAWRETYYKELAALKRRLNPSFTETNRATASRRLGSDYKRIL